MTNTTEGIMNKNTDDTPSDQSYTADSITVLENMKAVRMRPGMYIGDTDVFGLHHLVEEVVANCIDEALAGYCKLVRVTVNTDGSVTVEDDGRGIPVALHPQETIKQQRDVSALEIVMTVLHAGGKFDKDTYKVSGGLHGVGVSCVNALSSRLDVTVCRDGYRYTMSFSKGEVVEDLKRHEQVDRTGTTVTFKPDSDLFTATNFDHDRIAKRLRELAFLNKNVNIQFKDDRDDSKPILDLCYSGGVTSFVEYLNENKTVLTDKVIYFSGEHEGNDGPIEVEIALQWNASYTETMLSYVNNIETKQGGAHVSGFYSALTRIVNTYIKTNTNSKNMMHLTGEDLREGLTAVVSVKVANPQFEGQTKQRLGNSDVASFVQTFSFDKLRQFFDENPSVCKIIVEKAIVAAKAREAAKRARELQRKTALDGARLPGKLTDCRSTNADECEIFIVEGESAGGTAKTGRNSMYQAILPLKGKILNVEKARLDKILQNKEVGALISAFGCGFGVDNFDISKLRYAKIILMTDADVDGSHIRTLILTFLYRHMPQLIENGHVYVGCPPLFGVKKKKNVRYLQTEAELDNYIFDSTLPEIELILTGRDDVINNELLNDFCRTAKKMIEFKNKVQKKGVDFTNYLNSVNGNVYPRYTVVDGDIKKLFNTSEEAQNFFVSLESSAKEIVELYTTDYFETLVAEMSHHGLQFSQLNRSFKPIMTLKNKKSESHIFSIDELFDGINAVSKQMLEVQRYKGLGEMNADQLWDTTMDPERRTLVAVTLNDAIAADHMFSMLMGDEVLPRRKFIEQHALSVKDKLDI
jgi:DNA gyrase subunit B